MDTKEPKPDLQMTDMGALISRYTVLLMDAYGVLVNQAGRLPGADELILELNRRQKPYYILTNDASKLPSTASERFNGFGLPIEPQRVITSGSLLRGYFEAKSLAGARCAVLGPEDCARYVTDAGGKVVPPAGGFDVLVIGDESGYPFVETIDTVITGLFHKVERREPVHLILPNPDLIYPKTDGGFGIASGSIAGMIEAILQLRFPHASRLEFDRLGKPHAAIFKEALKRSGSMDMVMIGDQLETDIRGANAFGLDSALVGTGVSDINSSDLSVRHVRPTYLLKSLNP
jgi:HAD superfamily hydrolase (TIGR01450 family)